MTFRKNFYILSFFIVSFLISFCFAEKEEKKAEEPKQEANKMTMKKEIKKKEIGVIETDFGIIKIEFLEEKAPNTIENFKKLAKKGFYNGLTFHRVYKGFMIQGGCPKGDGTGDPGYKIKAEFNDTPHKRGIVSMARSAHPDSAGCQFFIMLVDRTGPQYGLDGNYTAFGKVIEGLDVIDKIAEVECVSTPGSIDRIPTKPKTPVVMKKVYIEEKEK